MINLGLLLPCYSEASLIALWTSTHTTYPFEFVVPENWNIYSRNNTDEAPDKYLQMVQNLNIAAVAVSPDQKANIILVFDERKLSHDELDVKSQQLNATTSLESLKIEDIIYNEKKWHVQETITKKGMNDVIPLFRSYHASLSHSQGTIRLSFSFDPEFKRRAEVVEFVLKSFVDKDRMFKRTDIKTFDTFSPPRAHP